MKLILCLCLCALLAGCFGPYEMSREEVIAAVNQCERAGMKAVLMQNIYGRIADVQCRVKEQEQTK